MKIPNTSLKLTMYKDIFVLKDENGLCVDFTHYNDLSISGRSEKPYFVGYKMVGEKLISVCEIQGRNASAVYEACANYNIR